MDIELFTLKKAKLMTGGGLETTFEVSTTIGGSQYTDMEKKKSTKFIHPDLENIFEFFKPMLLDNLGYNHIRKMVSNPIFKATDSQIEIAEKQYQFIYKEIKVIGIAIAGNRESLKVIGENNLNVTPIKLISTALRFDTSHGYEEDLDSLYSKLTKEVYQFIFENKISNPELGLE